VPPAAAQNEATRNPSIRLTLVAVHPQRSPQSVPLAATFLAAAVAAALPGQVSVAILDLYADQSPEECARQIAATRPDLAGFSVYLWNRGLCCRTADIIRQTAPAVVLFCGGPEASADRQRLQGDAPWDFIISGEGEVPLVAALQTLVSGGDTAAAADAARRIYQPKVPLDDLPSPFLSGVIDPGHYSGMLWQLSRGCSFGCDFCFDGGGSTRVRHFSLERSEAELRWLAASGISQVFVLDSTFNADRKRAVAILRLIRKIAPRIHFHFEVRSEFLDREQAALFAAITCSLQIGLQSGSSSVLQGVGRSFRRDDFRARIDLLNESGAIFGFDLIYGLPGDTLAGFCESLDFALGLLPNHLDIFPLALLPGTKLAARSEELQLHHLPVPPYTLVSTPTFPAADLATAARLAAACDIFYSRGKAVAWFMGIVAALQLTPAGLLRRFADWLEESGIAAGQQQELTDEGIHQLQCGFVSRLFAGRKAKKLLPLALDLIVYNHHYAAALLAVPPEPLPARRLAGLKPLASRLQLAPAARLATFSYSILELLEAESTDLRAMAAALQPTGSGAVIYPRGGEIRTEALHGIYIRLLEQLDGKKTAGAAAATLGLPADDAAEFLLFALAEGILVLAG
jgi:hypothetical protein